MMQDINLPLYTAIEEALKCLHESRESSELGNFLNVFQASKIVLRWISQESRLKSSQKCYILDLVFVCLLEFPSHNIAQAYNERQPNGFTGIEETNDLKTIVLSQLSAEDMMLDNLAEQFKVLSNPSCPSQVHVKFIYLNILRLIEEIQEIFSRVNGNQDRNFHLDCKTPFTPKVIFSNFQPSEDNSVTKIIFDIYDNIFIPMMPLICENALTQFARNYHQSSFPFSTSEGIKDIMEKYIVDANRHLKTHETKFMDENYPSEKSLEDILLFILAYLVHYRKYSDVEKFNDDKRLERKILEDIDEFSYVLHSWPLIDVLKDDDCIEDYLESLAYAVGLLIKERTTNDEVNAKLNKFNDVVCQLIRIVSPPGTKIEIIAEIKTVIQADILTTPNSSEPWNEKFENYPNKEALLSKCPHNLCCICYSTFDDIIRDKSQSDLAVLPSCFHLFCRLCIEKMFKLAQTMWVWMK